MFIRHQKYINKVRNFIQNLAGNRIQEKIFFLHVPKCGGTSADAAIQEAFGWSACLHLDSEASRKAAVAQKQDLMDYRNSLLPYFMEQNELRYISGHFVFNPDIYSRYSPDWRFVTLLRHPVNKYLSQYFYNYQKNNRDHFGIQESLEHFINTEEGIRLGQDMVQKISGDAVVTNKNSPVRKRHVEKAIEQIEKFHLVGILEDMSRFAIDFEKMFGASLRIKEMNINHQKNIKQLSGAIRLKIESLCEPDIELYNHVKELIYK